MQKDQDNTIGKSVGRIRIIGTVGAGGMGQVFLGYDEALCRKVALKSLHGTHALSPQHKARFLAEARILSRLDHPNICRIHDFVQTAEGDYLVLELIEGRTLREVIEEGVDRKLALRIALDIARALVVAHAEGIVHRDLKPSNVMLTAEGVVKVLDFGIARILDSSDDQEFEPQTSSPEVDNPALSEITDSATRTGTILGTPAYMSPEQAAGEEATPASDMHSFGLILQELFTGEPAHDPKAGVLQSLFNVAEGSSRPVSGLPRDLTNLVNNLKSLDPGSRPIASTTADELQRIRDKPKRHLKRIAVAGSILAIILSLLGGFVARSIEAQRANREAEAAKQISDFLIGIFDQADPWQMQGDSVTVREMVDQGAARIQRELGEQPELQARLMLTIGLVYRHLGLLDAAEDLLSEAVETRRRVGGDSSQDLAEALVELGSCQRESADLDAARTTLTQAVEMTSSINGPDDPSVATALNELGKIEFEAGSYDEAERLIRQTIKILSDHTDGLQQEISTALNDLGVILRVRGRYDDAITALERSKEIREASYGRASVQVAEALNNLGAVYDALGEIERASDLYERSLAIIQSQLGEKHPRVAIRLNNLGKLAYDRGKNEEAIRYYKQSLSIYEEGLGPDHPRVTNVLNNLAAATRAAGRATEAEGLYRRTLGIRRAHYGPAHPKVAIVLSNLAALNRDLGHHEQAKALGTEALEILMASYGPSHRNTAAVERNLARVFETAGELHKAAEHFERSTNTFIELLGADHRDSVRTLLGFAAVNRRLEDYPKAQKQYQELLTITRRLLLADADRAWPATLMAKSVAGLAEVFEQIHDQKALDRLWQQAVTDLEFSASRADSNAVLSIYAKALIRTDRRNEAAAVVARIKGELQDPDLKALR